jgi:DNA-binding transcriptional ArsR family regulator
VISDPKAFGLLADETRRRMVNLLRARELTVSQIAEELDKTTQNIYHHIKKLLNGGLVEVSREDKIENFVESYYRTTAEIFEVTHGSGHEDLDESEVREIVQSLSRAGLLRNIDNQTLSKAVKILKRTKQISFGADLMKKVESIEDAGLVVKLHSTEYSQLLLMSDHQFEEYQRLQRELRELLTQRAH